MVRGDLYRGSILTVAIHIGAEGQIALNGYLVTLVQILSNIFCQPAPYRHAVEDGHIIAVGVLGLGIGSKGKGSAWSVVHGGKSGFRGHTASCDDQILAHD